MAEVYEALKFKNLEPFFLWLGGNRRYQGDFQRHLQLEDEVLYIIRTQKIAGKKRKLVPAWNGNKTGSRSYFRFYY